MFGPVCLPQDQERAIIINEAIIEVINTASEMLDQYEKYRDIDISILKDPPIGGK